MQFKGTRGINRASLTEPEGYPRKRKLSTRQLHKVAPHLAYADHPASSSRAANPESFSVCATPRNASVPRVRLPHPCEANTHAPMYSKSPTLKGRASSLTRDLCNIRVYTAARASTPTRARAHSDESRNRLIVRISAWVTSSTSGQDKTDGRKGILPLDRRRPITGKR